MSTDKKISELPIATSVSASDVSILVNNDTDYQYTFTVLLQFLQANLATGANISFGTVLPQNTTGKNGDVFVNTVSGALAQKVSGTWTIVYTLPSANAADGTLLYGAGLPGNATGKDLDSYINTLTGIFYKKSAGAWSQVFSMATGPQGPRGIAGTNGTNGVDGNTILFGATNPSNTLTGVNGNFYINTSTFTLFGPKTAGAWGSGTSLLGAGIPPGGGSGQILVKAGGSDFDTDWQDNSFANLSGSPADNANLATALAAKQNSLGYAPENAANKNSVNGYAGLDGSGKVASAQLPSYVDDVVEYTNFGVLPFTGETGKIYVTTDNNKEYRWSGSTYIQLVASPGSTDAVAEGSTNLYFTAARVLATILTGIGFSSATAITATDNILGALGKLQAQFTALFKIPAGGTTGQVLAKVDGTDGNLEWVNPPAGGGGGGGYAARTFDEILTFDVNFKMTTTQTADIAFVLGSSPVEDVIARVIITGDGTHNCSFPSDWINANGQTFDNTKRNIIFFEYDGIEILYSIIKVETPDVTAPVLVSITIENTAKNKIVLTYSELLASIVPNISDYVINLSNVITSIVVAGSTVTIVCTDNFTSTDVVTVSYAPGTNKVQDLAGNLAASLTTHAVTNNVSVENRSLSVLAANQIPGTTVVPSNLAFGSGGSGGSDTPMSVAFWFKDVAISGTKVGFSLLRPGSTLSCGILNLMTPGGVAFYMAGNGGINVEHMNISNTVALTRAVWNHIVFTYDGNKLVSGLKIYVNGTLVSVTGSTAGTYVGQVVLSSDHKLEIGGGNILGTETIFGGALLDEFYWFNKELESSEVSEIYNAGSIVDPATLSFASHLKAGYKFDSDLLDISASGYNLTSTSAPTFSTDAL